MRLLRKVLEFLLGKQNKVSLRRRLLLLVLICWIVPVAFIFLFVSLSYRNSIMEKTEMLMEEWAKNYTSLYSQKINEAITISKKTSYELIIEKAWKSYNFRSIDTASFYREVYGNLKSKYYNDNRFVMSVFYLSENPDRLYYTSRQPYGYIDTYYNDVEAEANAITNQDTSDAHVKVIHNKIYIIRNLYTTTNYTKFGTLVLELNKDRLFSGMRQNNDYEMAFFINDADSIVYGDEELMQESRTGIIHQLKDHYDNKENRKIEAQNDEIFTGLLYQQRFDDYHLGTVLIANKSVIYSELDDILRMILFIVIIIIPVFIYMLYFIARHITSPIGRMIDASKAIEKGNIGTQVEENAMPNTEFTYLMHSFNRMSSKIKYIIDYAYNEELAKKEAKIIALQSQINPHFLNNTLEMMNWQARIAGDIEVTKMIEALGTLLDYTMDRSNQKLIHLADELRCSDAYLYITSMRFGQRLRVEKEIDESLLYIKVPQLILQPIIENAVVHGVEVVKNGVIRLKVYKEENNCILQVINTGKNMTKEDMERVQDILDNDTKIKKESGMHVSLGIHNVNERIKLIYGEAYGLTILPYAEGETASTITIPCEPVNNSEKEKLLKTIMERLN